MKDLQIRLALKAMLTERYGNDPDTRIIEELGLRHGASRVDVTVVNGHLHGFEIKGAGDTLKRLPRQVSIYSSVLDAATLVVERPHINEALACIPEWWGVLLAEPVEGAVRFVELRAHRENPSPDPLAIAKLMWRCEALSSLEELGCCKGLRSKPRSVIHARLAKECSLDALRQRVRCTLRIREGWRPAAPQTSYGD